MPAGKGWPVSYSAPEFSAQDEREERASLSKEERQTIEDEVRGTQVFVCNDLEESPERASIRLTELEECLRNKLPATSTAAYFEALDRVPGLIIRETNPYMFIRAEHFNIEKAANRLAMHWKERKALFGADRAFLPMALDRHGALGSSEMDMDQLERGYAILTPNDQRGRPVLFLDRANLTQDGRYDRESWLRVMWYLIHVIYTRPDCYKWGFVFVIYLKDYDPHKSGDRLGAKKLFLYLRECWCPQLKAFHELYGSRQSAVRLVEPALRNMQGRHIRLHLRTHYGFDTDNLHSLSDYGVTANNVGIVAGGNVTADDHIQWIQKQKEIERDSCFGATDA